MGYIQDRLEQDKKIAEATRVLLIPESNLEESDPKSLLYNGDEAPDYSKVENQIGCGYCFHEKNCNIRDPKINKAKAGCKLFVHYSTKL